MSRSTANYSQEERERRRQRMIYLNSTHPHSEKQRKVASERMKQYNAAMSDEERKYRTDILIQYGKSDAGKKVIDAARRGRIHSVSNREAAKRNRIAFNKSSKGKKAGRNNLIAYNRSDEGREATRKRLLAYWSDKNGYKSRLSYFVSEKGRLAARKRMIRLNALGRNKSTWIEQRVNQILLSIGLEFMPQYIFDGVGTVDFYCPRYQLVIEADGDYWHSKPGAKERDTRRDKQLRQLGLSVLRLPEHEINKNPKIVCQKIYEALTC